MRVPNSQRCSSIPPLPSGFSRLCSGPAPKPSSEIEKPATRTFVINHTTDCASQPVACPHYLNHFTGIPVLGTDFRPKARFEGTLALGPNHRRRFVKLGLEADQNLAAAELEHRPLDHRGL